MMRPLKMYDFYYLEIIFVGSLLRSDNMSMQSHQCVPFNCNNFPKCCTFMNASVMLETEVV